MLRHLLSMALRSLGHRKLYSFINIAGLSVALACAILILLFVRDQLSYDAWVPGAAGLYRLEVTLHMFGRPPLPLARTPLTVLRDMRAELPEVEADTYISPRKMTVTVGGRAFLQTVSRVDPDFLQVIELPLVRGDPARVLARPGSVVLSERLARKYFGAADPIGKVLQVRGRLGGCKGAGATCGSQVRTLEVTGVLQDLPHNTQLVADMLVPEVPAEVDASSMVYGYLRLSAGASPARVLAQLKPILDRMFHVRFGHVVQTASELEHFHLIPLREVHLTSDRYGGMTAGGDPTTVYGLAIIALLVLLIACSNSTNLATATASLRMREIALRKMAGARRRQVVGQLLLESVLAALISLAVAVSLVEVLLPLYDRFLDEPIRFHYLTDWRLLAGTGIAAVAAGLLSGLYPALSLSGSRPASGLAASPSNRTGSGRLRTALVLGQFAVSICLGIVAITIFSQIRFASALDLGFDRHDVVVIRGLSELPPSARAALKRALSEGPGIAGAALSSAVPFDLARTGTGLYRLQGHQVAISARGIEISPGFPSLYGMRLLAGRLLSATHGRDLPSRSGEENVLVNAEAARRLGYSPRAVLGARLNGGQRRIVGVLDDAMMGGVREPDLPVIYSLADPADATRLSVRVRASALPEALAFIDSTWHSLAPGLAMNRYFLSAAFREQLRPDERQATTFAIFVGIAILIGCLGLFGLAVFTAASRTKEIGIRKVSGARTADVLRLVLWRISAPVLAANLIAWPIAYAYLRHWLQGYAYRIELNPVNFLAAGGFALAISWATVLAHALRLARTHPVQALRYE
jgi:putative ABC transport system permease protein